MKDDLLSCSEVLERLPLYAGEDLEAEWGKAVERHLRDCAECAHQAELSSLARETLVGALRSEAPGGAPGLWPGIRSRLVADGVLQAPPALTRFDQERSGDERITQTGEEPVAPRFRLLPPVGITAAAAAVVAFVLLAGPLAKRFGPTTLDIKTPEIAPTAPTASNVVVETGGGLRRLSLDDERLLDEAEPVLLPAGSDPRTVPVLPVPEDASLAGYR